MRDNKCRMSTFGSRYGMVKYDTISGIIVGMGSANEISQIHA